MANKFFLFKDCSAPLVYMVKEDGSIFYALHNDRRDVWEESNVLTAEDLADLGKEIKYSEANHKYF